MAHICFMKRRAFKRRYKRPRRGTAKSIEAKAKSLQTSYRKYTGTTLTIKAAKDILNNTPDCPYCLRKMQWNELSFDHMMPSSRGGANSSDNLVLCCNVCNRQKGNLTVEEYKALLVFLEGWPIMKESVLLRLRAGGAALRRRRRY
jgi:5-methylcytosine-specific restriction endonuclease McrA